MMRFEIDETAGLVSFEVDGAITRIEFDAGVKAMEDQIAKHGSLRVLAVIRDFGGMELSAWWKDLRWGVTHWSKVKRAALVTDIGWIATTTRASSAVLPVETRVFALAEIDQARAWVRQG